MSSRTGSGSGERRRGARLAAAGAAAALLWTAPGEAPAYRFFRETADDSLIPAAAAAVRWSPEVWGPEGSLVWTFSNSPAWTAPWEDYHGEEQEPVFQSAEEILPYIRQGLDAWASLPSASIRWSLETGEDELHRERDHRNAVRIHRLDGQFSYAGLFIVGGVMVECDVSLGPRTANNLRSWGMGILIHEFGHCLGLAHSAMFPTWDSHPRRNGFGPAVWWEDPKMSYGFDRTDDLSDDDIVAASLLRPAPGWREGTGSLAGTVSQEGKPARFTRVAATRFGLGGADWTASVFADEDGEYLLEGLPPGRYLLAAGPMIHGGAHGSLFDAGAVIGARDRYLLAPIPVEAGERTRAPPVELAAGRDPSLWPSQVEEER